MSVLTDQRQYLLFAEVVIGFADILGADLVNVLELPQGSVIVDIQTMVEIVFAGGSTHDLDVGDDVDPNRYTPQSTFSLESAGHVTFNFPKIDMSQTTDAEPHLTVTPTHTGGDPTSGLVRVAVTYYVVGRQNENQG